MATPAELELLNAEIDGELDDRQRAELARALLADPQLRALREDLRRLCAALDAVPAREPPAQLREQILAAVPQDAARGAAPGWSAQVLRRAAVIAAVVAAGSVVYAIVGGGRPPATELAGTLAGRQGAGILDAVKLQSGPVTGRVSLARTAAGLELDGELVASAPLDVVVTRGEQTLRLPAVGASTGAQFALALPGAAAPGQAVALSFLMDGREVATATLRVPESR